MSKLFDILYPESFCNICKTPIDSEKIICGVCKEEYLVDYKNGDYCKICGRPIFYNGDICFLCRKSKRNIINRSLFIYDNEVKNSIYEFKYSGNKYIGRRFAVLMCKNFHDYISDVDLIIPVPIHIRRLLKRGFNQAEILCKYINKIEKIPFYCDIIVRKKYTDYLSKYTEAERRNLLKDAFSIKKEDLVKNKRILIVDDIFTTGATIDELSKLLINSGAKSVKSITIAVTIHND